MVPPKKTCGSEEQSARPCDDCSLKSDWMTTEQVAEYLCLSPGNVRNMTSNGQLPHYKLGRRNRYLRSEIQGLLLRNRRGVTCGN